MESSHLVIFSTSGKFITKFSVLRCISLSETIFWTGARGRIPITLTLPDLKGVEPTPPQRFSSITFDRDKILKRNLTKLQLRTHRAA